MKWEKALEIVREYFQENELSEGKIFTFLLDNTAFGKFYIAPENTQENTLREEIKTFLRKNPRQSILFTI